MSDAEWGTDECGIGAEDARVWVADARLAHHEAFVVAPTRKLFSLTLFDFELLFQFFFFISLDTSLKCFRVLRIHVKYVTQNRKESKWKGVRLKKF